MKFHLDHTPAKAPFHMHHKDALLLAGSCFAENIGALLTESKFNTLVNPSGILFNPFSLYSSLSQSIHEQEADPRLVLQRAELFYSYAHHSSFSATSKKELLEKIDRKIRETHHFLSKANYLLITFGSAYVYAHKELGQTVANCHKQPAALFNKRLLEVDEIVVTYKQLIGDLKKLNPGLKIIFTVSPVKYLKDGIHENNLSKATLLLATHQLVKLYDQCSYFPAFELLNDDLRDYRFFKEDLAHPNELAINYIWQKFSEAHFSEKTLALNYKIHQLNLALNHRQMQFNSLEQEKHQAFIHQLSAQIQKALEEEIS